MGLKNQADREKPIGVFDSGLGGLTVLKAIVERLPGEDTIYLGDTARFPYGIKSADTVVRYSEQNAAFLVDKGIKLLVVACNTASVNSLPVLKSRWDIPVVGVIEPGARAAAARTKSGRVGVIGTRATIDSGAYERSIGRLLPTAAVFGVPCPLFVSLAEEGWTDNDVADLVAGKYLAPFRGTGIDTLVLGCTHYPLLKSVIRNAVGSSISLIDSATETAKEVADVLEKLKWQGSSASRTVRRFYVTDSPSRFEKIGKRFLGDDAFHAEQVKVGGV